MTKAEASYPDFSAGEVSPRMYGRFDTKAFYSGARRMENFISQVTGGAHFRNGTVNVSATSGNNEAFLWVFTFSDALSFILEFTDQNLRFYRNNGRVEETAQTISGATNANPIVVTYDGADNYSNGDSVYITGVEGMTELNGNEYTVANVNTGANTFELSGIDGTSGYGTYTGGGSVSVITEVATPWGTADLPELKFAQKGVDLYVVHPDYNPRKITYASATSWSIASHAPTALTLSSGNYPRAVAFHEQRLIYGGSDNSPQTLWFSKSGDPDDFTTGTGADDGIQYTVSGDGNTIRWLRSTDRFLAIGTFSDVLKATGGLEDIITPTSISIKPSNSYGAADINPLSRNNQIFYVQRNKLILRSYEYDFQNDGYVAVDRNTISDHITAGGVDQICFQEGRPNLLWAVKGNGDLIAMTIEEQEGISGWHRHTTDGEVVSAMATPRQSEYDQLWLCVKRNVNGSDKYFIEYMADDPVHPRREDYVESTESADKTAWENLVFESGKDHIYVDSAYTYNGLTAGNDASATMTPSAVSGASVTFTASAGVFTSADVGRQIWRKSVTGAETGRAEITGYTSSTVVTCEILEDFDSTSAIPANEWYLTAGTVSGLDHLEGKTVSVISDGGQHPTRTVSGGSITLDGQASVVHVGLGYTGYLETNDIEAGGTSGAAQTKKKNLYKVGIRFLDSLFASAGEGYYNLQTIQSRTANMRMDRPPNLFTGDLEVNFSNRVLNGVSGGWPRERRVVIKQDQPFPCKVQLLIPYVETANN